MLEPHNRSLLSEQLQPPRGFELVQAVGTTFTLDLATALTIPLSFASRNLADHDDLGIIAALSRHTDRISIFTQAGEIRLGVRSDLVALLEDVVQPVHPPRGIFHPKVWLLEYASGEKHVFRFLCNSRNLTEDRSWDLSIRLDGELSAESDRDEHQEINRPLVAFLERLPQLTVRPLAESRARSISEFAERIKNVQWAWPEGVSDVSFHFLDGSQGNAGQENDAHSQASVMLQGGVGDALIISPFVSPEGLSMVSSVCLRKPVLVSRVESLNRLPIDAVNALSETFVIDDLLALDETSSSGVLSGLHAKAVFMSDRRYPSRARALIGSANITAGGLLNNVEMMVELHGRSKDLGPRSVLDALGPILEPYSPSGQEVDSSLDQAKHSLEARIRSLAAGRLHGRVVGTGPYSMRVWYQERSAGTLQRLRDDSIEITWRPLSKPVGGELLFEGESSSTEMVDMRLTEVTPFVHITASQKVEGQLITVRTIVPAELHDDIPGRRDAVLAHGMSDGDQFLKLLALLLDPDGLEFGLRGSHNGGGAEWSAGTLTRGLFESLLRSLSRGDDGLNIAQRILTQMREFSDQDLSLPDGFEELWDNVWQARGEQHQGADR